MYCIYAHVIAIWCPQSFNSYFHLGSTHPTNCWPLAFLMLIKLDWPYDPTLTSNMNRHLAVIEVDRFGFQITKIKPPNELSATGRQNRMFSNPQKGGNLQKILKKHHQRPKLTNFYVVFCSTIWDIRRSWKFDKVVWPRSDGSSYTSYWNLNFWGDLRIPETWVDIPAPSRICVNQQTIILQNENTLKHPTHEWGKPVGNLTNDLPKLNTKYSKLLLIIYLAKL